MKIIKALLFRFKETKEERKQIPKVILSGIRVIWEFLYYKYFKALKTFYFNGKKYKYFCYPYNATWRNERAIEIPIIRNFMKKYKGKNILEVGNVLSHYFSVDYDILDKYEKANGIINQDIVDFKPNKKYDLMVTISTLEHVGFDEPKKDSKKVLKAIKNLKKCLNNGGKIIVTIPLGYNPKMDEFLAKNNMGFNEKFYLKRVSKDNKWVETDFEDAQNVKHK